MTLPWKTPRDFAGEDPLVELAARAVGLRVVDQRVVVHVLSPVRDEEAVQGALAPSAWKRTSMSVRARLPRSRALCESSWLARPCAAGDPVNVERGRGFALDLDVLEDRALAARRSPSPRWSESARSRRFRT